MDHAAPVHQAQHLSFTTRRARGSLTPAEDDEVALENAGCRSKSLRTRGPLSLMLRVLRRIGRHGGRYDLSTVKHERETGSTAARSGCLELQYIAIATFSS